MAQQFIDIGANLTDSNYQGVYHGRTLHQADLDIVLKRAEKHGLSHIIITSGCLRDLKEAIQLIEKYQPTTHIKLSTTVGVHPTRTNELKTVGYFEEMMDICEKNMEKICAIGELGLDYDRLHFSDKATQFAGLRKHKILHEKYPHLPFFFHCRSAWEDFKTICEEIGFVNCKGVVHCYDGDAETIVEILKLGWDVGVTGLSLQTEDQLQVMRTIPLDRLHIETDCPYCSLKRNSAGTKFLKNKDYGVKEEKYDPTRVVARRNEPCLIFEIATIMAKIMGIDLFTLTTTVHANSMKMFFP
ncbi:hypothetical protein EIN_065660 [Entamoeba invadens IP1]|uniref:Uncharacterized protein n=1 Tax=Entamoeba invadens IP1 TaxID=370355 RepID=A0A0A1TVD1_ENTIV|nr:hypothetical protein EIN_065660 [Entamoeba invadens IP1]ELP84291.1 hypothetical protein EIN_065660 [Entamoeba invadens IP1]|eukprot:XP_004183637.1 hypothetical protein EIN_065660 [Entamoeba invadens IP1]